MSITKAWTRNRLARATGFAASSLAELQCFAPAWCKASVLCTCFSAFCTGRGGSVPGPPCRAIRPTDQRPQQTAAGEGSPCSAARQSCRAHSTAELASGTLLMGGEKPIRLWLLPPAGLLVLPHTGAMPRLAVAKQARGDSPRGPALNHIGSARARWIGLRAWEMQRCSESVLALESCCTHRKKIFDTPGQQNTLVGRWCSGIDKTGTAARLIEEELKKSTRMGALATIMLLRYCIRQRVRCIKAGRLGKIP